LADYQTEIYFKGLRSVFPSLPADFKLLEQRAQAAMPPSVLSYVQGGCGDEFTQSQNADAFHHWGLVPRMLVDCSTRDLTVDLFGLKLPTPQSGDRGEAVDGHEQVGFGQNSSSGHESLPRFQQGPGG
jgi:hypothetical protein